MNSDELSNVDPDDIEDWLTQIEKSFNFRFAEEELKEVKTFGELCDHVVNTIPLTHLDDCTTQQAFYKLRTAVTDISEIDIITPTTLLKEVLPRRDRISKTSQLECRLGFELSILRPPGFVVLPLWFILLMSFISLFFSAKVGVYGLLISCFGLWLAARLGKELTVETVGELAKKITRENYLASRRHTTTFNRNEVEDLLRSWLSENYHLSKSKLTRDAKFT